MIEFKVRLNDDGTMTIDPPPISAYNWCLKHKKGVAIALRDGGKSDGITCDFDDWLSWGNESPAGMAFGFGKGHPIPVE